MSAKDDNVTDNSVNETPPVADTDTSDQSNETPVEDVKADEQESTQAQQLNDADLNLLNKLEDLPEEEVLKKLETMDSSGRSEQADKMRKILNIQKAKPEVDDAKLQELVNKELERRGLTPDLIETVNKSKQAQEREDVIQKLGLNPDQVSKDEEFLKAYHSPDLKGRPVSERTELAIARTYVGQREDPKKVETAKNMTAPTSGDSKAAPKEFGSMSASEKSAYLRSLSSQDMRELYG